MIGATHETSGVQDGIKAIKPIGVVVGLIGSLENLFQGQHGMGELSPSADSDNAVNASGVVLDGDAVGTDAASPRVLLGLGNGQKFMVIGERVYTLDQLRVHGLISCGDVEAACYLAKFMHKVAVSVGEAA